MGQLSRMAWRLHNRAEEHGSLKRVVHGSGHIPWPKPPHMVANVLSALLAGRPEAGA